MIGNNKKIKSQSRRQEGSGLRPEPRRLPSGNASEKLKVKSKEGFTLIELIVAVAVFGIVVAAVSSIFTTVVGSQRKNANNQEILDNSRFVLEILGRAIRQSYITTVNGSGSSLTLNHPAKGITAFTLDDGKIRENGTPLTSDGVVVDSLVFVVAGNSLADSLQPRVTVSFSMRDKSQKPGITSSVNIQTTVTPRNLQIQ